MPVFSCICGKPALPGQMRCAEHQREWEEELAWAEWEEEQYNSSQSNPNNEQIIQPMRDKRGQRDFRGRRNG